MNNKINTDNLDSFFSYVSKAVIIIPVFVLITSLFLKFNQSKTGLINSKTSLINQAPTAIPTIQNNSFKFDLKGPVVCDNMFVKDKKVLLKNKLINYLLNGDCLYSWEQGKTNGEKKCGLTNYINMAENFLVPLNINDLASNNLFKNLFKDKNIDLLSIIKSCKKEEIEDISIFGVPEKVLFSDKK